MNSGIDDFVIRPYNGSQADNQAILEVYRQCEDFLALGPVAAASMEMVQSDLAHSRGEGGLYCLICSASSGEVWGIVDYLTVGFEGDPHTAYLSLLMISAPFRGQGLGEAVVRAVEKAICETSHPREIQAGVQVNNPKATRFWQRMGYAIISDAEQLPDGTVCYRLRKAV